MAIRFQPKIIIGSVIGFIASVIGILVAFFPSLFNLETKKIDKFEISINDCNGAEQLFKFLTNHEESIVDIDVKYIEPNFFSDKIINLVNSNSKYEDKQKIYKEYDYEWEIGGEGKSTSIFGENRLFNVESEAKLGSYATSFLRENGGFGFWCKNKNSTPEKDIDFEYQIIIPYNSENNTLYYWGDDGDNSGNTSDRNMEIKGIFLISKLVDADKYKSNNNYMYPNWCEEKVFEYGGDKCIPPNLFILQPMSKKDLELRKY